MGLFDGIGEAEIFERGKYFPPGFRGVLEVKRTIAKETVKSGIGFIVEFEVIEVARPGTGYNAGDEHNDKIVKHELAPVVVGEKRTWFQGMNDKTVAFPSIKEWAAAVAGYNPGTDKDAIEAEVAPELSKELGVATDNPADNDFCGQYVCVETSHKLTKKKNDFTVHVWTPYLERDEEPTDAVDEVG